MVSIERVFHKDRIANTAISPLIYSKYHLLSAGHTFQDPQKMPKITDSTKPYIYYFFLYVHIYDGV